MLRSRSPGGPPKPWFYEAPGAEKQNITFPYNKPSGAIRLKVRPMQASFVPLPGSSLVLVRVQTKGIRIGTEATALPVPSITVGLAF